MLTLHCNFVQKEYVMFFLLNNVLNSRFWIVLCFDRIHSGFILTFRTVFFFLLLETTKRTTINTTNRVHLQQPNKKSDQNNLPHNSGAKKMKGPCKKHTVDPISWINII